VSAAAAVAGGAGDAGSGALADALARLASDGLVAFPTETVWGLAAVAAREGALARLRAWKGRAEDQPLSLLVPDAESLAAIGAELPAAARALVERFWPGPLTLVLRCRARFPGGVARADGAVGFRCSPHPAAAALARAAFAAGLGPVTATSLNRSGEPPARTRAEAEALCAGAARGADAPALLAGHWPDAGGGAASTVVDVTGSEPRVLREGALPAGSVFDVASALPCAGEARRR
jgi:L-threonylcarbamoyladenylate synthase